MLYVPGKLLFIHIPRTAGNAITRTLAAHYLQTDSPVVVLAEDVSVAESMQVHRHSTAAELKTLVPDFDNILKIAVYRTTTDIIASDYRLHQACEVTGYRCCSQWAESVRLAKTETLEEFQQRRWEPWIGDKSAWNHWAYDESGELLDVESLRFDCLTHDWHWLCSKLGIECELPVIDWQLQQFQECAEKPI